MFTKVNTIVIYTNFNFNICLLLVLSQNADYKIHMGFYQLMLILLKGFQKAAYEVKIDQNFETKHYVKCTKFKFYYFNQFDKIHLKGVSSEN